MRFSAGQPFELVAHVVDVGRRGGQFDGHGDLACTHGPVGGGKGGEDLLVSGMLGRILSDGWRARQVRFGQVGERLAGDLDMLELAFKLAEVARELLDLRAQRHGLCLDLLLARIKAHEDRGERVRLLGHAPRQLGAAVPVSLRSMMVDAAQYNLDSVVRGLLS